MMDTSSSRQNWWFVAIIPWVAMACSSPVTPTPAETAGTATPQLQCPFASMVIPDKQCASPPPKRYGVDPKKPLEWGVDGGGKTLWFGRLMCDNGSVPAIALEKTYGRAPVVSRATPSETTNGTLDILDVWVVKCPGRKDLRLYHNIYRCGSPCPPQSLKLLPAKAFSTYRQSQLAHQRQSLDDALKLARDAYILAPGSELVVLWYALMLSAAGQYKQALLMYERAQTIHPQSLTTRIRQSEMLLLLKKTDDSATQSSIVLKQMDVNDVRRPYVLCLNATALMDQSPQHSQKIARQACALGEVSCCDN